MNMVRVVRFHRRCDLGVIFKGQVWCGGNRSQTGSRNLDEEDGVKARRKAQACL